MHDAALPSTPIPAALSHTLCPTRPPYLLRVMPAVHPICPVLGPSAPVRLLLPFSSARPNVRLVAMYRARRLPETAETRSRSCSVLCPVVGPGLPDRQHEAAVIPSPAVLASLPASRKIAMRPSRRCNPYHATHAWISMSRYLPCTIHSHHPAPTGPPFQLFFFCTYYTLEPKSNVLCLSRPATLASMSGCIAPG